jgi:hypothetical protein
MGDTQTVDYDALAKQYGAMSSAPPVDYDALAKQHGAITSAEPAEDPRAVVGETALREFGSMARNIAGIPSGIYHAFADEPTQEETQEAGGPQEVSGAKRIGLGIGRLTAQPLVNAVKWYGDVARGKVPNAYEQALSVAPEAMGAGAAAAVTPKLIESVGAIPGAVGDLGKAAPDLTAKVKALGKVAGQEGISRIPVAGRLVRRPSLMDYVNAARAKAPAPPPVPTGEPLGPAAPDPALLQGNALGRLPTPDALPASQTGEALGNVARPKLVDQVMEGEYVDSPPPPRSIRGALPAGRYEQPGGFEPTQPALPERGQSIRLPESFPPARQPIIRTTPSEPLKPLRLVDQVLAPSESEGTLAVEQTKDYPRLIEQVRAGGTPTRPVTENPVVGSLVRSMQKSGMPIAERPNLLLKGSGRVKRILGPEEDLTDAMNKSLRTVRRQSEQ